LEEMMKQAGLARFLIATSAVAFATLFSVGWSEQGGLSLSVQSAQARARLYVGRYYYNPYRADLTGVPWDAVRAYYAGGPWCAAGTGVGFGTAGGLWGGSWWAGSWGCYSGWNDYAHRNGIGCAPGSIVKGGDGINYVCQ
jgi:hypothetical protein